jgi:uncharacterized protein (DUF849 family)
MLLQAAIDGARAPGAHRSLARTPADQVAQAAESVAAGAGAIHAHARDARGKESLAAADVGRLVRSIRLALPAAPLGVSTGAWIVGSGTERERAVARWTELPDFASVNFDEAGATWLARLLRQRGVGVEAGLRDEHAAHCFAESGLAAECVRVLRAGPAGGQCRPSSGRTHRGGAGALGCQLSPAAPRHRCYRLAPPRRSRPTRLRCPDRTGRHAHLTRW